MRIKFLVLLVLLFSNEVFAKIRFLTFHCNRPDLIEFQVRTLAKFVKDDYELIVFNDAPNPEFEEAIRLTCDEYGVQCVRFEQEWHITSRLNDEFIRRLNDPKLKHSHIHYKGVKEREAFANHPSFRHSHVIQYAMDNFGYDHDDIVVLLDGDLFPIRPLDLRALLKNYDIVGSVRMSDPDYLWVPFIAMDMKKLPNKHELGFHPDTIKNYFHDTGANTYHYLKKNPRVKVRKTLPQASQHFYDKNPSELKKNHGFSDREIELTKSIPRKLTVEFHCKHQFLHFMASSFGSLGDESVDIKTKCIRDFVEKILAE